MPWIRLYRSRAFFFIDTYQLLFTFLFTITAALAANVVAQHGSQDEVFLRSQLVQRTGCHEADGIDALRTPEEEVDAFTVDGLYAVGNVLVVQPVDCKGFVLPVGRIEHHVADSLLVLVDMVEKHLQFGRLDIGRHQE